MMLAFALVLAVTLSSSALAQGSCPEGWKLNQAHCYDAHELTVEWFEAQRICSHLGASLATIPNSNASDFVQNELDLKCKGYYWIGVTTQDLNVVEYWADGSPFIFANLHWASGYPKISAGYHVCIDFYQLDGTVRDIHCAENQAEKRKFICSKFA